MYSLHNHGLRKNAYCSEQKQFEDCLLSLEPPATNAIQIYIYPEAWDNSTCARNRWTPFFLRLKEQYGDRDRYHTLLVSFPNQKWMLYFLELLFVYVFKQMYESPAFPHNRTFNSCTLHLNNCLFGQEQTFNSTGLKCCTSNREGATHRFLQIVSTAK